MELNIECTGIAQEKPVLLTEQTQTRLQTKNFGRAKRKHGRVLPTEPPVITVSCYYVNDLHKNTTIGNLANQRA